MTRISAFLLLLTLCAGCAKFDYQYGVVCDFPVSFRGQSWVVVSNDAGSILKIFTLPEGSAALIGEFHYEAKEALETYNLHLVNRGDSLYPVSAHPQSSIWVRMRQGEFTTEKLFPPGAALRLEGPDISIKAALFSPFHTLQVATEGSPDMVEVHGYTYDVPPYTLFVPPPSFEWRVQGPPASFVKMRLPDLTELLPALRSLGPEPISWQVTAYKYDHLDHSQLLAGFPDRGNAGPVFPIIRSGLQKVTKKY